MKTITTMTQPVYGRGFRKNMLSASICALMVAPLLPQGAAHAEEGRQYQLEEITVTARKRDEDVMDVPVSISAMSSEAIADAGVSNITELFALMPGVENNADGSRVANKPTIRGVGTQENASIRAKVTSFIDGVPLIGAQGIGSFAGLQHVEVLRGPQSAAFGRSTFGGAINYVTRDPGEEFELELKGGFASHDSHQLGAVVSVPLVDNKLSMLVTLEEKKFGGDDDWKTTSGDQLGGTHDQMGTIKLAFNPSDSLSAELLYLRQEIDDDAPPVLFASSSQLVPHPDDSDGLCAINGGGNSCVILGEVDSVPLLFDYDYDNAANPILDPGTRISRERIQGSITLDLANDWSLTALGAYSEEEADTWFDRDTYTGGMAIHAASTPESIERYAEVRLSSPAENRLNWLVGASIYDYDYVNTVYTNKTAGAVMDLFSEGATNVGAYFSLGYAVSDRLTASFEGRYQVDEISGTYPASPSRNAPSDITDESETTSFQPRLALTYALSDHSNVYLQIARGNNPAGYNTNALDPILLATAAEEGFSLAAFQTYEEEEIWSYELGLKGDALDNRLRYSAAVYYLDWTGYVNPATANWTPDDGELLAGTASDDYYSRLFLNTGDLDGFGVEFEGTWAASEQLVIGAVLSYNGIEFTDDSCSPIPLDYGVAADRTEPYACAYVGGAVPPMLSRFTNALNATYTIPLDNGYESYVRLDYQYRSKRYIEQTNTEYLPGYDTVNLRAGLRSEKWSAELYANNLLDDDTPSGGVRFFDNSLPGMVFNSSVRQRTPRSIGINLTYSL